MLDFAKPTKLEYAGMYFVVPTKKGFQLEHNAFIMPVAFRSYKMPKWLQKMDLKLFTAYWINPKEKQLEECKDSCGDGNGWTAGTLRNEVIRLYQTTKGH